MEPEQFTLAKGFFLQFLAGIYCIAFISLSLQIKGLNGSQGILPAKELLQLYRNGMDWTRYIKLPTLFWISCEDSILKGGAVAGAILSLFVVFGVFLPGIFLLLWLLYLSYMNVCREFLSFQWDVLLLEVGFMAIFLSIGGTPSWVLLLAFWLLLFRLKFSSGLVKLLSRDPYWRDLTALCYHFESQPLPTKIGWWVHQLPYQIKRGLTALALFVELVVPFGIFGPPEVRFWSCMILISLQIAIFLTGNYCFFNLLTALLCILLLPNADLATFVGRDWKAVEESLGLTGELLIGSAGTLFLILNALQIIKFVYRTSWMYPIFAWTSAYHISGGYGLFAVMTTKRREIVIEGSQDGVEWKAYELSWKPQNLKTGPLWVAPHQPRLDWQFWFASLSQYPQQKWLQRFVERLLQGSPEVLKLLGKNPFADSPPKWIRLQIYEYHFTDIATWKDSGLWWKREYLGNYSPVVRLS